MKQKQTMGTKARHLGKIAIESAVSGSGKLNDSSDEIETATDDSQVIKARREQKQRNRRIFRAWARGVAEESAVCVRLGQLTGGSRGASIAPSNRRLPSCLLEPWINRNRGLGNKTGTRQN